MKKLYHGLGYEYYTASLLRRLELEAYKMDADFGFDIMVYNQKERTFEKESGCLPYLFQVKSVELKEFELKESSAGIRKEVNNAYISLSLEDFNRILEEEHAFLQCYFFEKLSNGFEEIIASFWLSNYQINLLNEMGYFKDKKVYNRDCKVLDIKIQTLANPKNKFQYYLDRITKESVKLDTLISAHPQKEEVINKINYSVRQLENLLERSSMQNIASNTNVFIEDKHHKLSSKQCQFLCFRTHANQDPFAPETE